MVRKRWISGQYGGVGVGRIRPILLPTLNQHHLDSLQSSLTGSKYWRSVMFDRDQPSHLQTLIVAHNRPLLTLLILTAKRPEYRPRCLVQWWLRCFSWWLPPLPTWRCAGARRQDRLPFHLRETRPEKRLGMSMFSLRDLLQLAFYICLRILILHCL